jgi:hypothetical protein
MKLLTLLLVCIFFSLVLSQPEGKPLPKFGSQESGLVHRKYGLSLGQTEVEYSYKVDTVKQRAYTKIRSLTQNRDVGEYWLIWLPDGAIEGTEEAKGYVLFKMEDPNPDDSDSTAYCSYLSTSKIHWGSGLNYPPEAFPDHWDRNYNIRIQPWIETPSGMTYSGVVSESGNQEDTWVSFDMCYETDYGVLPCNKISCRKDTNIPTSVFYSQDSGGASFRTSWWYIDRYLHYSETATEIQAPENWLTRCYNARNGFDMQPWGHAYVSTPIGTDNFTLALTGIPIDDLGPVVVSFMFDRETCCDCIAFEDADGNPLDSISFTSENWKNAVLVRIRYLREGETYFFVTAVGGGYDIPEWHSFFKEDGSAGTMSHGHRVLTCANGVVGFGCDPILKSNN